MSTQNYAIQATRYNRSLQKMYRREFWRKKRSKFFSKMPIPSRKSLNIKFDKSDKKRMLTQWSDISFYVVTLLVILLFI